MKRVNNISIFHNVGQGLFYTSDIKFNNSVLRIVYDCGSENKSLINMSIKNYKKNNGNDKKNKVIDLLVLSHLHYDHTSGLNELFKNFKVKDVVLPYLLPEERLILALKYINKRDEMYFSFLSDPVIYLIENGVERVILIGGEMGGERGNEEPEISEFEPPTFPPEGGEFKLFFESNDQEREKITENEGIKEHAENIYYVEHNKSSYFKYASLPLWIIRFFNFKLSDKTLAQFKQCLSNCKVDVSDKYKVKNTIKDPQNLQKLIGCYKLLVKGLKNFNNTSLIMYHGPMFNIKNIEHFFCLNCWYPFSIKNFDYDFDCDFDCDICSYYFRYCRMIGCCCRYFTENSKLGQLLTGDTDLNFRFNEIKKHFSKFFDKVLIGMVPHHGAKNNWNGEIIQECNNSKFWIASAGIKNRYRHPSKKVLTDIMLKEKCSLWANELNSVIFRSDIFIIGQ